MKLVSSLAVAVMLVLATTSLAAAAGTPAGTVISNTATATYTDADLNPYTVSSNTVQVTVQQVYALTLAPAALNSAGVPGGLVYYSHTLQNVGNGADTYTLNIPAGYTTQIFHDVTGNGLDAGDPVVASTGLLAADAIMYLIVEVFIPNTAVSTDPANLSSLTATSVNNAAATVTVVDTTTVTDGALLVLTQSDSVGGSIAPGSTIGLTSTVTNNGASAGKDVVVTQNVPADTIFVLGSVSVVDGSAGASTISFEYLYASGWSGIAPVSGPDVLAVRVTFSGAAGGNDLLVATSASLSFNVAVSANAPAGTPGLVQTSVADYKNTSDIVQPTLNATRNLTVNNIVSVALSSPIDQTVPAGTTAFYSYTVTNAGNATDTITLTVDATAGFTTNIVGVSGATPTIVAGGTYAFTLEITPAGTALNGAFATHTLTATSLNNALITDTDAVVTTVNRTEGVVVSPATAALSSVTNTTVVYVLTVQNTGNSPDVFTLAGADTGGTATLPFTYTIWRDVDGSGTVNAGDVVVGSTLELAAAGIENILVEVAIPAGALAAETDVYTLTATSTRGPTNTSGTSVLTTTVAATRSFTFVVNGAAAKDGVAGSYANYLVDLTNTGNASDSYTLSHTRVETWGGWAYYIDSNGSGTYEATDTQIVAPYTVNLAPGQTLPIIARLTIPAGTVSNDITTLTATPASAIAAQSVVLTTSVGTPNITLLKEVSVNGGAFGAGPATAVPGDVLTYRVTYTNTSGINDALSVVISDTIPAFTVYNAGTLAVNGVGVTDAADADAGTANGTTVEFAIGTVLSSGTGNVSFQVTIQ